MTFPRPQDWNLVVATHDGAGQPTFFTSSGPDAVINQPGVVEGAIYWRVDGGHSKENPGARAKALELAGPNGSTVGVACFPANSAGKLDMTAAGFDDMEIGQEGDPSMHSSDTIDYVVVLSGKVDSELPGGKIHTLVPGDLLVMAGVPHAWKNRYDEDCLFLHVNIGLNPGWSR